jgi:hypothetical protein
VNAAGNELLNFLKNRPLFSSCPTNQLLNLENVNEAKGLHTKENNNKFIMTVCNI